MNEEQENDVVSNDVPPEAGRQRGRIRRGSLSRIPRHGSGGGANPAAEIRSLGFVSMRVRTVAEAAQRARVDELVQDQFVPEVEALDGFAGFLLGDVIDTPDKSLSIVVLDEAGQAAAFDEAGSRSSSGWATRWSRSKPSSGRAIS